MVDRTNLDVFRRLPVVIEPLEARVMLSAATQATVPKLAAAAATLAVPAAVDASSGVLTDRVDIGSPALSGSSQYAGGTYTVSGSGQDIAGTSDQFGFAYVVTPQDIAISARVASINASDPLAKSGVVIRNAGTNVAAPMAAVLITKGKGIKFIYRPDRGGVASTVTVNGVAAPQFVRLVRSGYGVSGYYSADGVTWRQIGSTQTINYDSGLSRAGLAVLSHNNTERNTSTFTNVAIMGDNLWSQDDIGSPLGRGSVGYDGPNGITTLLAGGSDIFGTADQFNFMSQSMTGDGTVIARIESLQNTDDHAKAGVMIRADKSAGSAFAAVLMTPTSGVRFEWRTTAGGTVNQSVAGSVTLSVSLKLIRSGNTFTAFYSTDDGANWTNLGALAGVSITMPSKAFAGLAATAHASDATLTTATFTGVSVGAIPLPGAGILTSSDEAFLDDLEKRTAMWFVNTENDTSGLFPDRANVQPGGWLGGSSSVAGTGFGLTALAIASSRGWINDGYDRALKTLNFLWSDADMSNPQTHGYFYHFVDQTTGKRSGTSELSSIDTALLISGVLEAGQYWKGTQVETLANQIYERVDWTFMQPNGPGTPIKGGWTPEDGYNGYSWADWSEGPLLYLIAMGSPTHPITSSSWFSFPRNPWVTTYDGMTFYHTAGSPLFTNQYPQAWFDLRGKLDRYDADPGSGTFYIDPYQNSRNATLAQRQALIDAKNGSNTKYDYYGPNAWGLTASDRKDGYDVYGGPPLTGNVDGTMAPTGPGGSIEFTPRQSIDALEYMKTTWPTTYRAWGFIDAFNPRPSVNWYDNDAIGIDQGMLLISAENARSEFVWNLFMSHPAAQRAVSLAFKGGGDVGLSGNAVTADKATKTLATAQPLAMKTAVTEQSALSNLRVEEVQVTPKVLPSSIPTSKAAGAPPTWTTWQTGVFADQPVIGHATDEIDLEALAAVRRLREALMTAWGEHAL